MGPPTATFNTRNCSRPLHLGATWYYLMPLWCHLGPLFNTLDCSTHPETASAAPTWDHLVPPGAPLDTPWPLRTTKGQFGWCNPAFHEVTWDPLDDPGPPKSTLGGIEPSKHGYMRNAWLYQYKSDGCLSSFAHYHPHLDSPVLGGTI